MLVASGARDVFFFICGIPAGLPDLVASTIPVHFRSSSATRENLARSSIPGTVVYSTNNSTTNSIAPGRTVFTDGRLKNFQLLSSLFFVTTLIFQLISNKLLHPTAPCTSCGQRCLSLLPAYVSVRSMNGAPSRKGCVVNGVMVKRLRQATNEYAPPPVHVFSFKAAEGVFFVPLIVM